LLRDCTEIKSIKNQSQLPEAIASLKIQPEYHQVGIEDSHQAPHRRIQNATLKNAAAVADNKSTEITPYHSIWKSCAQFQKQRPKAAIGRLQT
jgi:hypothetical protein